KGLLRCAERAESRSRGRAPVAVEAPRQGDLLGAGEPAVPSARPASAPAEPPPAGRPAPPRPATTPPPPRAATATRRRSRRPRPSSGLIGAGGPDGGRGRLAPDRRRAHAGPPDAGTQAL